MERTFTLAKKSLAQMASLSLIVLCLALLTGFVSAAPDYEETLKAAEQGSAVSQHNLGLMYYLGQGVKQDYTQAAVWFRKAAEQGNADAQFNLGIIYYQGLGVRQDYVQAANWYRQVAEQNNAMAQTNLGVMYYKGEGVKQDKSIAKKWFSKACDNGDQNGCEAYKQLSEELLKATEQSVEQKYVQTVNWYNLGILYFNGQGVEQDYPKAFNLFRKSAERGYAAAQLNLGYMYFSGQGVMQDKSLAKEWFGKACDNGIQLGCDNYKMLNQQGVR